MRNSLKTSMANDVLMERIPVPTQREPSYPLSAAIAGLQFIGVVLSTVTKSDFEWLVWKPSRSPFILNPIHLDAVRSPKLQINVKCLWT